MSKLIDYVKQLSKKYYNKDWEDGIEISLFYAIADDKPPSNVPDIKLTTEEILELTKLSLLEQSWFNKDGLLSNLEFCAVIAALEGGSASKPSEDPRDHED